MAEQTVPANDTPDLADRFVGLDDVARRLAMSPRTVRRMIERGELPKPCLSAGGRPRWLWSYIVEFCRKRHGREATADRRLKCKLR